MKAREKAPLIVSFQTGTFPNPVSIDNADKRVVLSVAEEGLTASHLLE